MSFFKTPWTLLGFMSIFIFFAAPAFSKNICIYTYQEQFKPDHAPAHEASLLCGAIIQHLSNKKTSSQHLSELTQKGYRLVNCSSYGLTLLSMGSSVSFVETTKCFLEKK